MSEQTREQLAKLRKIANDADKRAQKLKDIARRTPMELAIVVAEIRSKKLFKYTSPAFDKAEDWFKDRKIPKTTFYRWSTAVLRLQEAKIPLATIRKMRVENADFLGKLKVEDRNDPKMIEKALSMTEDDFIVEVQNRQRDNGEPVTDSKVNLKIRVYPQTRKFIMDAIETFSERHNLERDNPGRALELMVAEVLSETETGKAIVVKMSNAIRQSAFVLAQARGLRDSELSADEVLKLLFKAIEDAILALHEATEGFSVKAAKQVKAPPKGKAAAAQAGVQ